MSQPQQRISVEESAREAGREPIKRLFGVSNAERFEDEVGEGELDIVDGDKESGLLVNDSQLFLNPIAGGKRGNFLSFSTPLLVTYVYLALVSHFRDHVWRTKCVFGTNQARFFFQFRTIFADRPQGRRLRHFHDSSENTIVYIKCT